MKPFRKRKGFTLAEIIVTVGIMALIATIAFPHFIRVRKRAQAVRILEGLRLIEGAKDQWAMQGRLPDDATPIWDALRPYVKAGSALGKQEGATVNDLLGNPYTIGPVNIPPSVSQATYDNLKDFVGSDFWGAYWNTGEGRDRGPGLMP